MLRHQWHLYAFAAAAAVVLIGTFCTAGTVRYSRHGVQLPEKVLVEAWNPQWHVLVKSMRDYVKEIAK